MNGLSLEWAFGTEHLDVFIFPSHLLHHSSHRPSAVPRSGFNNKLSSGVHNLSDEERFALFYVSAHSGVIYDCSTRTQKLLQGHCNPITACAVSADKKWIATADAGPDSLIVVWDSHAGTPVKTFFNPAVHGIAAVDISADGAFLATLSALSSGNEEEVSSSKGTSQTLAVWEWTSADQETALFEESFPVNDPQFSVRFNPQNP